MTEVIKSATIKQDSQGKWYCIFTSHIEDTTPKNLIISPVGLDAGLTHFLIDSDGNKTVISNIGGNMEDVSVLVGNCFPFITNLDPTERNGHMSEAMIVADINDNVFNHKTGRKCS